MYLVRKKLALLSALALTLVLLFGCLNQPLIPGPTQPPAPTADMAGTVTAQVAPLAATQAALVAASTQVAQAQGALTAQAVTQAGTTQTEASSATQTALAEAAGSQAATSTALAEAEAGQQATATALAAAVATNEAQGTALAQKAADTPVPPTRAPTRVPGPTSATGCVPADATLAPVLARALAAGIDPGCPTGSVMAVNGAVQEYWANAAKQDPSTHLRSLMIWREDQGKIYVVRGEDTSASRDTVASYSDTYQDGEPEVAPACATMKAPAGYQMPIRGFGRIWCASHLASTVGWPNRDEAAASLRLQPTRDGLLMKVSAPDAGIGYLVAIDARDGRAVAVVAR